MERRADRTADTRERIERAALHHFVHQGVAETSIRDIAEKAGVSLGAMYNHFESKDDLAFQLFIHGWDKIGRELRRGGQGAAKFADKLNSMIGSVFRLFDEDWLLVTYVFSARHQQVRRISAARGGGRDNPYTVFRLVIAQAMGRGEIPRGDLDLKTALIFGAIMQSIDSRMLLRLKGKLADQAPTAARLCHAMLSG